MEWIKNADYTIFRTINVDLHSPLLDPIGALLSYSGLGLTLTLAILSLLIWPKTRRFVLPLLISISLSGFILADAVLKPHVLRQRPSNLAIAIREEPHLISSFPSGHSSISFAAAFTILFLTWKTPTRRWGWLALIWALLVGLSRIYRGVHWPSDVVAGCFNGLFSAAIVVIAYNRIAGRQTKSKARAFDKR